MRDEVQVPDEIKALELRDIQATLAAEIRDATTSRSELREQQREGLSKYLAKPWNVVPGESSVQLDDVRDTVEWILPTLMRMFCGGQKIASFAADSPETVALAQEATEAVNKIFRREMAGELVIYDLIKTSLIEKVGVAQVRSDGRIDYKVDEYEGLTAMEVEALSQEENVRILEVGEPREEIRPVPIPGAGGAALPVPMPVFDVRIFAGKPRMRIVAEAIPTEEFMIGRKERALDDDTRFVGCRRRVTLSDLIDRGLPRKEALELPAASETPVEELEEIRREDEDGVLPETVHRADAASREVWLYDVTMRLDEDGDGHAELRRILCVGEAMPAIIHDDYVNSVGFMAITPYRLPFQFAGQSVADLIAELQDIRSTLLRQHLNALYRMNHPRMAVMEDEVELEALIKVRPGGVIPTRGRPQDVLMQIDPPNLGSHAMEAIQFLDQVKEDRAGAARWNQGLDGSALNETTATGVMQMMAAASARIELIARLFVPGFQRLFGLILRQLVETPDQERTMQIAGAWRQINPNRWNPEWLVDIEVGLGQGRMQERIVQLEKTLGLQIQGMQAGLASREKLWNTAEQMVNAMGLPGGVDHYYDNPRSTPPPPPPGPDIDQQIEQEKLKIAAAELQLKQAQIQETARDHDLEHQRTLLEIQMRRDVEMARIASQEAIAMAQADATRDAAEIKAREAAKKPTPKKRTAKK